MTKINDIKPLMDVLPINIINSLVFIIFVIILYFIYKKINNKQQFVNKVALAPGFGKVGSLEDYLKKLKILEKNNLENSDFYPKLLAILRGILEYKGQRNISKMTLQEINNLKINDNLKKLIKQIYFKEYMQNFEDNIDFRKNYINEVKKLIK